MKSGLAIVAVIVVIALVFGGVVMGQRNDLVVRREAINRSFSDLDTALQRRADLIPNLVETVKGYAKQERDVFTAIANARAAMLSARNPQERIAANSQLDGLIGRLLVLQENYPQLKSDQNFIRLQDELANTENRIRISRMDYNQAVQSYNVEIQRFPKNITAGLFGFQREDAYYKADPGSRNAPSVKF